MARQTTGVPDLVREVPASVGQRLLWLMNRHRGEHAALNERLVWEITGELDQAALRTALGALALRHEALRTRFAGRGRGLVQRVSAAARIDLKVERVAPESGARGLERAIAAEANRPLNLELSPLRARLLWTGERESVLFVSIHHLVTDFASNAILAADLAALYERAARRGDTRGNSGAGEDPGEPELEPIAWQYADWSEWQRARLESARLAELQSFWSEHLAGAQFVSLPWRDGGSAQLSERAYERRRLGPGVAASVEGIAQSGRVSRFAVALAAFYVHLYALTGQRDISLASLFANRARAEVGRTVGFFVNMLVMRGRVDPGLSFAELVRATQQSVDQSTAHQELPYQMLPPRTVAADTPSGPTRADDLVFQYIEGEPRPAAHARIAGLRMEPLEREWRRSRFGLELFVAYDKRAITPILVYDTGRLDREFARRFADGYEAVLAALEDLAGAPVEQLAAHARPSGGHPQ